MSGVSQYAWQGTQGPESSTGDFQERMFLIESVLNLISTATLVKVVKAPYDTNGNSIEPGSPVQIGYIDVQPLVNQVDGYGNATPHGIVYHLSYHRYSGGNGAFITDPVVGDIGKMVSADRDISAVKATNQQANPGSGRQFDKADGTYFGTTQGATAPSQWFAWTEDGFNITDKHGNSIVSGSSGIVVTDRYGNKMNMNSAGIDFTANHVTNTKEIIWNTATSATHASTHTHDGVQSGSSNTTAPNPGS